MTCRGSWERRAAEDRVAAVARECRVYQAKPRMVRSAAKGSAWGSTSMNPRAGISLAKDTRHNITRAPSAGSKKEGEFGFETRSHVTKSDLELLPPPSSVL